MNAWINQHKAAQPLLPSIIAAASAFSPAEEKYCAEMLKITITIITPNHLPAIKKHTVQRNSISYLYYVCSPDDRPWIYNGCVFGYRCCPGLVSRYPGSGIWGAAPPCQRQRWSGLNPPRRKEPLSQRPAPARPHCPANIHIVVQLFE